MKFFLFLAFATVASSAVSETLIATKMIRANTVIQPSDILVDTKPGNLEGLSLEDVVGMEARVVIYPGRPIASKDIVPPAVVLRNQLIPLIYDYGGLSISTVGRALDRGAVGQRIKVMNSQSKATVIGIISEDGSVHVSD